MSDTDKFSNKVDEAKGRAKETAGAATGDESLKSQGRGEQTEAQLSQAGEKAKDAVGKVKDAFNH